MQFRSSCSSLLICLGLALAALGGSGARGAPEPDQPASTPPGTTDEGAPVTNPMCPVLTDEAVDPEIYTEYQGHRVYLCCQKCKRLFERNPEAYVANLAGYLQDLPTSGDQHARAETGAMDHRDDHQATPTPRDEIHLEHEHGSDLPPMLKWIGKFHPATVHFPIGLLLSAGLAEFLFLTTRRKWFDDAGRFCLWVGTISALAAATLGWLFGGLHLVDDDWLLTTHRWVGTATAAGAMLSLYFSERLQWRRPGNGRGRLRLALALVTLLVSAAGFFGGAMIYGIDHFSW